MSNRVAAAQAHLAHMQEEEGTSTWNEKNGHGPNFEIMITADPVDCARSGRFGDNAVGTAYETVLRRRNPDGNYETHTVSYYVEAVETTNQPVIRDSHVVVEAIELIVHSDYDDPGGSELSSEYFYGDGSAYYYDDLADAEAEAKKLATWVTPGAFE